ncbi:MAG: CDP-alcohol phosphatidyltransferase family protein [Patescibacteria group bacterium]
MSEKLNVINKIRELSDWWLYRLPWPNINPSIITFLAIPFSIAFILLWDDHRTLSFIFLILTLTADWLDGVIAKKHKRDSRKGWYIDVITDRISEGIIFLKFFHPWFYFFLLNVILTAISAKIKKNFLIVGLRQLLFLYLISLYTFLYFYG